MRIPKGIQNQFLQSVFEQKMQFAKSLVITTIKMYWSFPEVSYKRYNGLKIQKNCI